MIYDQLLALPHVTGVGIAFKRRNERATRTMSVVACVDEKIPRAKLRAKNRVPASVSWALPNTKAADIATDVQVLGATRLQGAIVGPGDQLIARSDGGLAPGTIGVAMRHPTFGRVVTTAAHVVVGAVRGEVTYAPGHEPRVEIQTGSQGGRRSGVVHRTVMTADADYALVGTSPEDPIANLYDDRSPVGAPYAPQDSDLGKSAFVLTAARGIVGTRLRGMHFTIDIQGLRIVDALLTDLCTVGGDSGAPLVNPDSRLMGFVEGATSLDGKLFTAHTAVSWPFIREQARFL